jgi:hypothetical protein
MPRTRLCFALSLALSGCAADPAQDFPGTRMQYAVLTEDQEALRHDFQMAPERSLVERGLAGLSLPFTLATEAAFWPARRAFSSGLDE